MKLPRILIFTVTYEGKEYAYKKFNEAVKKLTYTNTEHLWIDNSKTNDYSELLKSRGHKVLKTARGNNTREALARSQEVAREYALNNGFDYMLSLESDLYPPPDTIERLLGHCKEMVGVLYFIGEDYLRLPCITLPERQKTTGLMGTRLLHTKEIKYYMEQGLKQVNSCGLGCTLIKKDIFENIGFMFYSDLESHSDVFFANDVWTNGFRIFVDTNLLVEHENVSWSTVKDR